MKTLGMIMAAALALTVFILAIEINFYTDTALTVNRFNEILCWSFIKSFVISAAVHIGNHYRNAGRNTQR